MEFHLTVNPAKDAATINASFAGMASVHQGHLDKHMEERGFDKHAIPGDGYCYASCIKLFSHKAKKLTVEKIRAELMAAALTPNTTEGSTILNDIATKEDDGNPELGAWAIELGAHLYGYACVIEVQQADGSYSSTFVGEPLKDDDWAPFVIGLGQNRHFTLYVTDDEDHQKLRAQTGSVVGGADASLCHRHVKFLERQKKIEDVQQDISSPSSPPLSSDSSSFYPSQSPPQAIGNALSHAYGQGFIACSQADGETGFACSLTIGAHTHTAAGSLKDVDVDDGCMVALISLLQLANTQSVDYVQVSTTSDHVIGTMNGDREWQHQSVGAHLSQAARRMVSGFKDIKIGKWSRNSLPFNTVTELAQHHRANVDVLPVGLSLPQAPEESVESEGYSLPLYVEDGRSESGATLHGRYMNKDRERVKYNPSAPNTFAGCQPLDSDDEGVEEPVVARAPPFVESEYDSSWTGEEECYSCSLCDRVGQKPSIRSGPNLRTHWQNHLIHLDVPGVRHSEELKVYLTENEYVVCRDCSVIQTNSVRGKARVRCSVRRCNTELGEDCDVLPFLPNPDDDEDERLKGSQIIFIT